MPSFCWTHWKPEDKGAQVTEAKEVNAPGFRARQGRAESGSGWGGGDRGGASRV